MIQRKKKICIQCGQLKFIFSHGKCQSCTKFVNAVLKKGNKKEKKETISSLIKELDKVFSLYIRLRNADRDGMVTCYTSGKRMYYKQAHCGHFISRRHYGTRWSEINCQVQSLRENLYNQGNAPEFQRRLIADYGQEAVDLLFIMKGTPYKLNRQALQFKINEYSEMVKQIKERLGIS